MEITLREVIASITILAIMLIIGIIIGDKINDHHYDKIAVYNKALKVKDEELFRYGMNTNVGNAFVEGEFKALDPVSYDEIDGKYMYIEKVKERYTQHTRTVTKTRTVNGKPKSYTTTETYWTWDVVDRESKTCNKVSLLGVEFPSSKFYLPSDHHLETRKESSSIRYKYYGTPVTHNAVAFVDLRNGTINDNKVSLDIDTTTENILESKQFNIWIYVFWVAWICLTSASIYGFCYLDNDWLNLDPIKKKRGLD